MELFNNITDSGNEKAVKIGTNVPSDGVNLAWFTSESISPDKNISIIDISETIPENKIKQSDISEIMYADELGILRRLNGSSFVATEDITISNTLIDRKTVSSLLQTNDLNPDLFGHYFYISKYFTVAPSVFQFISLNDYIEDDVITNLGIKVLDEFGKDYVNELTNKKKYKVLLEPFRTLNNTAYPEIPYRIYVLLDVEKPINLKLMYNKVESDENGNIFNHQLRYTETINAVKYYKEVPEESFVIDPNYYGYKNFSIKKIDEKYTNININNKPIENGYQVIVPSKAIKDYRTYEVFNWRLIARIKRNLNFDQVNYGIELDQNSNIRLRTIKAAIIKTNSSSTNTNPYSLYRLENSPFNLTKLRFENPLAPSGSSKNQSDYWAVNIDTVSIADMEQFDVLIWSPDSTITANQASLINYFVSNKFGTVILDLSLCPDASLINSGGQLTMQESTTATTIDMIDGNYLIDSNKNGGWSLNDNIFEKDYYGIFGSRLIDGNSSRPKTYKYFSNSAQSNSFLKAGSSTSNQKDIGIILGISNSVDSISKGNIVATTFNLLAYCNSIYDIAYSERVISDNSASTHDGNIEGQNNIFSSIVEGPFKLLFNAISYGIYCKTQSSRQNIVSSSLINFVTDWESSWVMYSEALEDDEKIDFDVVSLSSSESVYAKNLTSNTSSNESNLFSYLKSKMNEKFIGMQRNIIAELSIEDVSFYIEITNPDVQIKDAEKISDPNIDENISSSYNVHKITNSQLANSPLYAYTKKYSPSLQRIAGLGPHILINRPVASSSTKSLNSSINFSSGFNSYPFRLSSSYSSYEGNDLPSNFNCDLSASATLVVNGESKTLVTWFETETPAARNDTLVAQNFQSAIDDLGLLRTTKVTESSNVFPYTGDIDIHGQTGIWKRSDGIGGNGDGDDSSSDPNSDTGKDDSPPTNWAAIVSQIAAGALGAAAAAGAALYYDASKVNPYAEDETTLAASIAAGALGAAAAAGAGAYFDSYGRAYQAAGGLGAASAAGGGSYFSNEYINSAPGNNGSNPTPADAQVQQDIYDSSINSALGNNQSPFNGTVSSSTRQADSIPRISPSDTSKFFTINSDRTHNPNKEPITIALWSFSKTGSYNGKNYDTVNVVKFSNNTYSIYYGIATKPISSYYVDNWVALNRETRTTYSKEHMTMSECYRVVGRSLPARLISHKIKGM